MVITHTSAHKSRNLTVLHDITCTTHVETKEGGSQVGHGAGFCAVMLSRPPPLDSGGFVRVLRAAGKRSGDQMGGPHDEVGLAAPIVLIAQPTVN